MGTKMTPRIPAWVLRKILVSEEEEGRCVLFCGMDKEQGDFHIINVKSKSVLSNKRTGAPREILVRIGVDNLVPPGQMWITVCLCKAQEE